MVDGTQNPRRRRMDGPRFIYGLLDAQGVIRYVGQTGNLKKRLSYHWNGREKLTRQVKLQAWLLSLDARPGITVLQEVAAAEANAAERAWIVRLSQELPDGLLNLTSVPGWRNDNAVAAAVAATRGAERPKVSQAVREAWRTGRKTGHPISAETARKISAAQKGRPLTEEHKQALREGWARRRARLGGTA